MRGTNFGQIFEVHSQPDSNDLAYRAIALAPHTDNSYREPVPGIQLLRCLVNETSGGLSTLVDGLAATEALRGKFLRATICWPAHRWDIASSTTRRSILPGAP